MNSDEINSEKEVIQLKLSHMCAEMSIKQDKRQKSKRRKPREF